jgi:hypothetical protein
MHTYDTDLDLQELHTPFGLMHIWRSAPNRWVPSKSTSEIRFEVPEEEGGLTMPSGNVIYTTAKSQHMVPFGPVSQVLLTPR